MDDNDYRTTIMLPNALVRRLDALLQRAMDAKQLKRSAKRNDLIRLLLDRGCAAMEAEIRGPKIAKRSGEK